MLRRRIRRERCDEGDVIMMIIYISIYIFAINFFAIISPEYREGRDDM